MILSGLSHNLYLKLFTSVFSSHSIPSAVSVSPVIVPWILLASNPLGKSKIEFPLGTLIVYFWSKFTLDSGADLFNFKVVSWLFSQYNHLRAVLLLRFNSVSWLF